MTMYELAQRFVGEIHEVAGVKADPFIVWCLQSCAPEVTSDEVPWCSGFMNRLAWLLRLPRSKSLRARSWLKVGVPVAVKDARLGDVMILKRGTGTQPGPEVIDAPGHVTLYAGAEGTFVLGLGGNQSDGVTVGRFKAADVLGVRRLA